MQNSAFLEKYGPASLVTGASSGIGAAFAENLASRGCNLVLAARRADRLAAMAAKLSNTHGVTIDIVEIDLAAPDTAQHLLAATAQHDIGLLVCNAGFSLKGELAAADPAELSGMFMLNSHTPLLLAQGFAQRLKPRGHGGIVFTSSVEALIGMPYSAAYAASKSFVLHLGEAVWAELRPHHIDVLTICPGATDTEALQRAGVDENVRRGAQPPAEVARLALENLADGPVFFPNPHYAATMENLLKLPRRDALTAIAAAMRK